MFLRTLVQDCLYLNWAIPRETAPDLPAPLRYDRHPEGEREYVFASMLLFRFRGLKPRSLPFLGLSYPQMNLRLYITDGDGIPSVLFLRTLVPSWVVPMSRLVASQPSQSASFAYPRDQVELLGDGACWSVWRRRRFEVTARAGAAASSGTPRLGSWQQTVDYFRRRARGYVVGQTGLRSLDRSFPDVQIVPVSARITESGLLRESLGAVDPGTFEVPHSAWLCPEIAFVFELGQLSIHGLPRPAPAGRQVPAAGC